MTKPIPQDNAELIERLRSRFLPAVLHGDAEHRAWLTASVEAFIADEPIPPPTGKGNKEARIAELEAQIESLKASSPLLLEEELVAEYAQRIQEIASDIGRRWDGGEIQIREVIFEAIRRGSALGRALEALSASRSHIEREVIELREALADIASVDRAFVNAHGADGAIARMIERAEEALARNLLPSRPAPQSGRSTSPTPRGAGD